MAITESLAWRTEVAPTIVPCWAISDKRPRATIMYCTDITAIARIGARPRRSILGVGRQNYAPVPPWIEVPRRKSGVQSQASVRYRTDLPRQICLL